MKRYFLIVLTSAIAYATTCKKEERSSPTIYGQWKLTEILDNFSGNQDDWQSTTASNDWYVQFNQNGSIQSDNPDNSWLSFKVIDSVTLQVMMKGVTNPQTVAYNLSGNVLEVSPQCYEACGYRYKRLK